MGEVAGLRLAVFFGLLLVLALMEWLWPRRQIPAHRRWRWSGNLGMQLINALVLRLLVPAGAVGIALLYAQHDIGLLQGQQAIWVWMVCLLLLDLAIYAQHVATHHWPWLWRLHRMHHSDMHVDTTTALRFHPLEIVLSMGWKALVLAILGAPPGAVLLFEILLNGTALFNHANLRLPARLDRFLRCFVVTPDMHRVHHSVSVFETNSNYGFNLPWWDWLFGTYRAQPQAGHTTMQIGLGSFRSLPDSRLDRLLLQPWRRDDADNRAE